MLASKNSLHLLGHVCWTLDRCALYPVSAQIRSKRGRAELVLLDHGLYRRLSDDFRLEYAGLWRSLVFGDEAGIRRHAAGLNAGDSVQLFAGMLTMRPWDEVTRCAQRKYLLY